MVDTYSTAKVDKLQKITQKNGYTAAEEKDAKELLGKVNERLSGMKFKYWTPVEDDKAKGNIHITLHKRYDILLENDDSIYIIDDIGRPSAIFDGHNGKFD